MFHVNKGMPPRRRSVAKATSHFTNLLCARNTTSTAVTPPSARPVRRVQRTELRREPAACSTYSALIVKCRAPGVPPCNHVSHWLRQAGAYRLSTKRWCWRRLCAESEFAGPFDFRQLRSAPTVRQSRMMSTAKQRSMTAHCCSADGDTPIVETVDVRGLCPILFLPWDKRSLSESLLGSLIEESLS